MAEGQHRRRHRGAARRDLRARRAGVRIPEGHRLEYANLYRRIVPAMREADIAEARSYGLRHTTGMELKRRKASLEQIRAHLGHHDLSFTKRVYIRVDS